jgi:hypothetical protein
MYIEGMYGLGDNIYQRAFVKKIKDHVYLRTPWVELYQDLPNISFIKPDLGLRTQSKNILSQSDKVWTKRQKYVLGNSITVGYGKSGMIDGMSRCFRAEPDTFDLPDFSKFAPKIEGKYALVRPVTIRKEWAAQSRNCLPEYVATAADMLKKQGYTIVSVADLEDNKEWGLEPLPKADIIYHKGELNVKSLLGLSQNASVLVGAVGWILPAAVATKTPAWLVLGGYGAYNHPSLITDSRYMDISRIGFAVPDNFCRCDQKAHLCDKRISDYEEKFSRWSAKLVS